MAAKPRNKAAMDAEAVARMMAAQDQDEEIDAAAEASPPAPALVQPEAAPTLPATLEAMPAAPVDVSTEAAAVPSPHPPAEAAAFDPGKIDGRTLRRTGREPFATRIKPEAHEALRRIAYHRRITIAEALEMAVAAFDNR
ncbi:hypothetical protein MKK75_01475 [Methylobacterium sp. J-030]|uniref:hypothetical protein n=1 Tax=Methylobacterium sp. J-030 TaxID=2836627 RepID=UPI001FBA5788|nr:hypothetical protein [Methylobacterium sp. J-030]MCJ2067486.1 hypothetical protein [Methylobacterium sp. J-030]